MFRVIFHPKEGEFGVLTQGGDSVVFVKSNESPQHRREQRYRVFLLTSFHSSQISALHILMWIFRQHRLKHHGSFFKQDDNETTEDMTEGKLMNEPTAVMTEVTTKPNTSS